MKDLELIFQMPIDCFFAQIEEDLMADDNLLQKAQVNSKDNFKYVFDDAFLIKVMDRMGQNQEIFKKIMDNEAFQETVKGILLDSVYSKLRRAA